MATNEFVLYGVDFLHKLCYTYACKPYKVK